MATTLVETGSRMDDMIFEEFKGTGNMEVFLDRKLSEKRIYPAIDIYKSSTRREDLLFTPKEQEVSTYIRRLLSQTNNVEMVEKIMNILMKTKNNQDFMKTFLENLKKK